MKIEFGKKLFKATALLTCITVFTATIPALGAFSAIAETTSQDTVQYYAADFSQQMSIYHSDSALSTGLTPASFTDYYSVDGQATHTFTGLGTHTGDLARFEAQDDVVTTGIYTNKTYRNFDMTVTMRTDSGAWDIIPGLLFGVQDPVQWINQKGGGYAVGTYNEGRSFIKGSFNGTYQTLSDPQSHNEEYTVNKGMPELYGFVGYSYGWYNVNVRVEGTAVTVKIGQAQDWITNPNFSYTYQLDSSYTGGYVGFVTPTGVCSVHNFKITDLGGEVLLGGYNSLTNKQQILDAFDFYHSDAAMSSSLVPASFDNYFGLTYNNMFLESTYKNLGSFPSNWDARDNVITTGVYNRKAYRNFEMSVMIRSTGWDVLPKLIFGVEEPTRWINKDGGGYEVFLYNEGKSNLCGMVNGTYSEKYDTQNPNHSASFDSLAYNWVTLKVRVEGNKATVTVVTYSWANPNSYSFVYDLDNDYSGGYIGFAAMPGNCRFAHFSVTDLGGEVRLGEYNDLTDETLIKDAFDFYHSDSALSDNLAPANFNDYFALTYAGMYLQSTYTGLGANTSKWDAQDDVITTAIYNKKAYQNFEMSVKIHSPDWETIPKVVFGVDNPTRWINSEGGGYEVFLYDNTGLSNLRGMINGSLITLYDTLNPEKSGSFQGFSYDWVTLKVRVEGSKATVTVITYGWANPNTYSFEYDLGANYTGGYVGFAAMPGNNRFAQFTVKDLGGEAAVQPVKIQMTNSPDVVSVPVLTFAEDLVLPTTVTGVGDDGNSYSLPVEWDTSNYNRFNPGNYVINGTLSSIVNDEGRTVSVEGVTATMTVQVTGEAVTPVKVACVGDSITFGDKALANESYPSVLQQLSGARYDVRNFGVCGATAQNDKVPYTTSTLYQNSLDFNPDVVILMIGTNDGWNDYWNADQFRLDYTSLVEEYLYLNSNPTVYIATSPACYIDSHITEVVAIQKEIAQQLGCQVIDMYTFTSNHDAWFSDGVHPTAYGYGLIGRAFAKVSCGISIKGDGNDDWLVNVNDLTLMKKAILGAFVPAEGIDLDMNSENGIEIRDLVRMKKLIADQ